MGAKVAGVAVTSNPHGAGLTSSTHGVDRSPHTTTIPFDDFGGEGPLIHFAHANGFPPATYRQLLARLAERAHVVAIHHPPLWPGQSWDDFDDWRVLGVDVIQLLESLGARDVVGIGHSLGGVATIYAAAARPDLFRALVLIEPVLIMPEVYHRLGFGKPGAEARIPIIRSALQRRERFPDRRAAFEHWRAKATFARLTDATLWNYVNAAITDAADAVEAQDGRGKDRAVATDGVSLLYPRDWEARIYATIPVAVWEVLPQLRTPTLALRGEDTDTISPDAWREWQVRQPGATFVEVPGTGHLLPLESPDAVAEQILGFLGPM